MTDPIDMLDFVTRLAKRPRGRAAVVLSRDYLDQKDWAADLALRTGSEHLDVLDLFAADATLSAKIGSFLVDDLFNLLGNRTNSSILVVTGIEFLLAAWSGQANIMDKFGAKMELWSKTPALLFVMQHDRTLAERKFRRYPSLVFVVDQGETLALV